jgi:hypothetical protein
MENQIGHPRRHRQQAWGHEGIAHVIAERLLTPLTPAGDRDPHASNDVSGQPQDGLRLTYFGDQIG